MTGEITQTKAVSSIFTNGLYEIYTIIWAIIYKARSHQVAFPQSEHGVVKFLESPYIRRKFLEKLYNFIWNFYKWKCQGVLTATEEFLPSSRGV